MIKLPFDQPAKIFLRAPLITLTLLVGLGLLVFFSSRLEQPLWQPAPNLTPTPEPTPVLPITTELFFEPNSLEVKPGQTISLDLQINSAENIISGVQIQLGLDAQVVKITAWQSGQFWVNPFVLQEKTDQSEGQWLVVVGSLDPQSGQNTLLHLDLEVAADAAAQTTYLTFTEETQAADPRGTISVLKNAHDLPIKIE